MSQRVCDASAVVALLVDAGPDGEWATRALIWQLRANLTAYDASYVALAELLGTPLVTLDRRIGRSPRLRCEITTPSP